MKGAMTMAMKDDEVEGNYQAKKFPLLGAAVNWDCLVETEKLRDQLLEELKGKEEELPAKKERKEKKLPAKKREKKKKLPAKK